MAQIHDEVKALVNSTARKMIEQGVDMQQKQILNDMLDASSFAGLGTDTLDENARKQLYRQHLLKIQYAYLEYLKKIPQTIINTETPSAEQVQEYLSEFDTKHL